MFSVSSLSEPVVHVELRSWTYFLGYVPSLVSGFP